MQQYSNVDIFLSHWKCRNNLNWWNYEQVDWANVLKIYNKLLNQKFLKQTITVTHNLELLFFKYCNEKWTKNTEPKVFLKWNLTFLEEVHATFYITRLNFKNGLEWSNKAQDTSWGWLQRSEINICQKESLCFKWSLWIQLTIKGFAQLSWWRVLVRTYLVAASGVVELFEGSLVAIRHVGTTAEEN